MDELQAENLEFHQDDSSHLEVLILERSKAVRSDNTLLRKDKKRMGDNKTDLSAS